MSRLLIDQSCSRTPGLSCAAYSGSDAGGPEVGVPPGLEMCSGPSHESHSRSPCRSDISSQLDLGRHHTAPVQLIRCKDIHMNACVKEFVVQSCNCNQGLK